MVFQHSSRVMLLLQLTAVVLHIIHAAPQQKQNAEIDKLYEELFSKNPKTNEPRTPQDQITDIDTLVDEIVANEPAALPVTPIKPPIGATDQANAACKCVAYHMCGTNNTNGSSGDNQNNIDNNTTNDGEIDGFGKINPRFDFGKPRIDLMVTDDAKCQHFLDICCDSSRMLTETIAQSPKPSKGCGIRNVGGLDFTITGANNHEAAFGEFSWTVALLTSRSEVYFCGGSLIHPRVVLTANHCLLGRKEKAFKVRAGEWDTQTTKERLPYVERTVQRIIPHPQYNQRSLAYDYALVILSEGFTLDDHINTVCLPAQNSATAPRTTCFSTGWGKDVFGAEGRYSAIMKRVPLPIVDFGDCVNELRNVNRLGPRYVLDRSFICAGGQRGIDTCEGDGGAPLVCPIGPASANRYQQSGIVAWGIGCNNEIPAAYANVALARDWIDEQMRENGFSTDSYSAV